MSALTTKALWCPRCRGHLVGETLCDGNTEMEALRCVNCGYLAIKGARRNGREVWRVAKSCQRCGTVFQPTGNHQFQCEGCRA